MYIDDFVEDCIKQRYRTLGWLNPDNFEKEKKKILL